MKAIVIGLFLVGGIMSFTVKQLTSIETKVGEHIKMRIQSKKVACGESSMCYMVQKESSIGKDNWEVLNQEIEGFNFEEGYIYDVTVTIEITARHADHYDFKYTLVDVISKIKDK